MYTCQPQSPVHPTRLPLRYSYVWYTFSIDSCDEDNIKGGIEKGGRGRAARHGAALLKIMMFELRFK